MDAIDKITPREPWVKDLIGRGAQMYIVGGAVRDRLLGKRGKDVDVVVRGLPGNDVATVLMRHGGVKQQGKSFSVFSFTPRGWEFDEPIDVALPRKEISTGPGHKDFKVEVDPMFNIVTDLERRDFTINSLAIPVGTPNPQVIDPFGGVKDLRSGTIRMTNPKAFSEDPLRMLRAMQFASRFDFHIDDETYAVIQANAGMLTNISRERIAVELDKLYNKADSAKSLEGTAGMLTDSGLYKGIFGVDPPDELPMEPVKNFGDFMFVLLGGRPDAHEIFNKSLKGLKDHTRWYKYIKAMGTCMAARVDSMAEKRHLAHRMASVSPESLASGLLRDEMGKPAQELLSGEYPMTIGDMDINGNDLMELGYEGPAISEVQDWLLIEIYADRVKNSKDDLVYHIMNKKSE